MNKMNLDKSSNRDLVHTANIISKFIPLTSYYSNGINSSISLISKYVVKDKDWKNILYAGACIATTFDLLSGIEAQNSLQGYMSMTLETSIDALTLVTIYKDMVKDTGKNIIENTLNSTKNIYKKYKK